LSSSSCGRKGHNLLMVIWPPTLFFLSCVQGLIMPWLSKHYYHYLVLVLLMMTSPSSSMSPTQHGSLPPPPALLWGIRGGGASCCDGTHAPLSGGSVATATSSPKKVLILDVDGTLYPPGHPLEKQVK